MPNKIFAILALLCAPLVLAQTALVSPWINVQFTDSAGHPLSGGLVYSCNAGSISCPGSPLATYNSSSGGTPNSNPIVLDSAGRASIWLTQGVGYKFVVTTAGGQVINGAGGDNIFGAITALPSTLIPSGPTNAVQLNGGSNTLLGTSSLTFDPSALVLRVTGTTGQASIVSATGYIQSFGGFLSTFAGGGNWQGFNSPTDGAFLRGYGVGQTTANTAGGYIDFNPISYNPYNGSVCTDSFGNHVQQPLPLNGLAGFGSTDALLWVGNSPSMPAGGSCGAPLAVPTNIGLNTNAWMFARGGLITDNPGFNSITSLFGGAYTKLGVTVDQALYPKGYASAGSLNTPGMGYGGFGYQGGSIYYYFNGTSGTWNTVDLSATGGGGTGCVLGATATGQILFNLANVCTSSANLTWVNSTQQMAITTTANNVAALTIGTGYILANGGFNAGTSTAANAIHADNGGITSKLTMQSDQFFSPKGYASSGSLNVPTSGYGGLAYAGASIGSGATYYYYNQSTPGWASVDFSTTGSGCTLGGTATGQVLFNLSSACTSNANFTWNNSTAQLGVVTSSDSVAGITVGPGLVSATGGFNSLSCTASNCVQAPNGGILAGLGLTTNQALYPKGYASSASLNTPPATYGGIGYTGAGLNYWVWNATTLSWNNVTLGSGGGGGGVAGPAKSVQYNSNPAGTQSGDANLTWDASAHVLNVAGAITLLGAPSISASNQFVGAGGVNVAAAIQSQITTSAIAFQTSSSSFTVTGAGDVSATGTILSTKAINNTGCSLANCVQSSGGISSSATGTGVAFQTGSSTFTVLGNGTVQGTVFQASGPGGTFNVLSDTSLNSIQTVGGIAVRTGGFAVNAMTSNGQVVIGADNRFLGPGVSITAGSTYQIALTTVISAAGAFTGPGGVNTSGAGTFSGILTAPSLTLTSGLVSGNAASSSTVVIGSGNFYVRPVAAASTTISCSGVAQGWMAYATSDNMLVVCNGSARFRTTFVSF